MANNENHNTEEQAVKKWKVRDTHGNVKKSGSLAVVGSVNVEVDSTGGDHPTADSTYQNGQLGITFHDIKGERGNGIRFINVDESQVDEGDNIVHIHCTDDNTEVGTQFRVKNGSRGNGIASVTEETSSEDGGINTHTIHYTDPNVPDSVIHTRNGSQGRPGADFQPIEDVSGLSIAQGLGGDETKVISQKAVTDEMYEQRPSIPFAIKGYYIDNNNSWVTHNNANAKLYKLDSGDIVRIKSNAQYPYVIAFVSNTTLTGIVVYANNTEGRIIAPSENHEGSYYVEEPCYLYVLDNAATTSMVRTPTYVKVLSDRAGNVKDDCNILEWSDGVSHVARGVFLRNSENMFIKISAVEPFCVFYELNKRDIVKVKGNGINTYAIAFISRDKAWDEIRNGDKPDYVNGTTAMILASTADEERTFEIHQQCYLYVLGNSQDLPNVVDRLPIVKVGKSIVQAVQDSTTNAISAMKLEKFDAIRVKGFFINAYTNVWVENQNGLYYLFPVKKDDLIVITPNSEREASVAFLNSTSHVTEALADYVTWKSGITLVSQKTTFNIGEDCYMYVLDHASSIQTVRYPSEIGIRRGIFASTENRLTLLEENTRIGSLYDFEGEKPVFGYRYNLELLVELLSDMSAPTYTLHQGMAVYDNYLVAYGFNRNDSSNPSPTIGIYNITNGTLIAEIQLPYSPYIFPHGNSLSFGKNKLQSSSIMPPLYVTQWDGNKGVLVYDVTLEDETYAAELVQAIIPDMPDSDFTDKFGNGESDIVIDADNGKMYSMAYTLGTDGPYTDNDVTNPTKVCVFDLPEIDSTIEHVIGNSDVIEHFSLKSLPYRQGCCVHSGKLVIERGNTQASRIGRKVDIHIVNLKNREIITKIPLNEFCESNQSYQEPEGIAVYHGHLIMGWRGSRNIFKFVF